MDKIKEFYALKKHIEELTKQKDKLGEEIKEFLKSQDDMIYFDDNGYIAKIVTKTIFKYSNEKAIVDYLDKSNLADIYVTRKVNVSKLNDELKVGGKLYEDLRGFTTENKVDSLIVDKIDSVEDLI